MNNLIVVGATSITYKEISYNKVFIIFTYKLFTLINLLLEGFNRSSISYILKLYRTFIRVLFIKLYFIKLFNIIVILGRINSY